MYTSTYKKCETELVMLGKLKSLWTANLNDALECEDKNRIEFALIRLNQITHDINFIFPVYNKCHHLEIIKELKIVKSVLRMFSFIVSVLVIMLIVADKI